MTRQQNRLTLEIVPDLSVSTLQAAYAKGLKPSELIQALLPLLSQDDCSITDSSSHNVWISRFDDQTLIEVAKVLDGKDPASLPLYGIPFAIKDNIDVAGLATTAACPAFAYLPEKNAFVVQKLIDAGAIPLGKANLDQFATGLNGTRSPYGIAKNSIDARYISGGSSSGSALAVALGLASFALGTDTAGSGRVPAAFNELIGVKPSCGLLSSSGVVPACRTLDSVSIFTQTIEDAEIVLNISATFDPADSYSKPFAHTAHSVIKRIGVPRADQLSFFGDDGYAQLFEQAKIDGITKGFELVDIDFSAFITAANLLYSGPWVAERYHAIANLLTQKPEEILPVIRQIVEPAQSINAVQTFDAFYKLASFKRQCDDILNSVDAILTPTTGTIYTIDQMLANPLGLNSNLGYYTNFMNLLNYSALAIPAGRREDDLPFGITFFAQAGQDWNLLDLAKHWQA